MASNEQAHGHGEQTIDPAPFRPSRRKLITTVAVAITVLSTLAVLGMVPRLRSAKEARDDRERMANQAARVQVEKPTRAAANGKVVLPGTVQAVQEAVVYARTS